MMTLNLRELLGKPFTKGLEIYEDPKKKGMSKTRAAKITRLKRLR
jgi:hypothetical protein